MYSTTSSTRLRSVITAASTSAGDPGDAHEPLREQQPVVGRVPMKGPLSACVNATAMPATIRLAAGRARLPEPQRRPDQRREDQEGERRVAGEDDQAHAGDGRGQRERLRRPARCAPERPVRRGDEQRRGDDQVAAQVAEPPGAPDRAELRRPRSRRPRAGWSPRWWR